jgi:hypothetical protein
MHSSARTVLSALVAIAATMPLAAQTTAAGERIQYMRVIAKDYVFDAPATVPAGITTIQLINQGADVHHITLHAMPEGRTVKEYFDATRNAGRAPAWVRQVAQTPTIPNGGETFVTLRMPAGRYILSCLIPAADGRSHVAKGMYQIITATGPAAAAPTAARRPGR